MKTFSARIVVGLIWLLTAAAGICVLFNYEKTAGRSSLVPQQWPAESRIAAPHNRHILVMFAHPKCPCTRASIDELNRLLMHCEGRVTALVLFVHPNSMPSDWTTGSSWNCAAAIPGVSVQEDFDGNEARRFGAETSGFTVLYGPDGRLLFAGGLTVGKGHAGHSPGAKAIAMLVAGTSAESRQAPVYGCSLLNRCDRSVN